MLLGKGRSAFIVALMRLSLLFLFSSPALAKDESLPLASEERGIYHNKFGAVVLNSKGQRINYSKEQLEAQALHARANTALVRSGVSQGAPSSSAEATWGYATLGSGIGLSNIIVEQNGVYPEIYSAGGYNTYWIALRYNSTTQDYDEVYVSPFFSSNISRIKVADVVGDSGKEIIVALEDGHIYLYDQATKALLSTLTTSADGLTGLDVADVDGDGANELVICTTNHLYVYSGNSSFRWDLAGVGGADLIVGQMDADSALEIATTDGHVIDGGTRSIQWTWPAGFGFRLAAADIDGDGMKELIVAEQWYHVWAYDVDRQLPKWSLPMDLDVGALLVADIDGDGSPEVLVGQGQWGSVIAYDPVTLQQKGAIRNPEHGVTNVAVGDVDRDGNVELLWGAGATSSGPDHLYVANWQNQQIKWQNIQLDGPFIGPAIGDLDGDGRDEMVVISSYSNGMNSNARILVFDATSHKLRAISDSSIDGFGFGASRDLRLRDVNRDGRLEILVAGVSIGIISFDSSNTFSLKWANSTPPPSALYYVDAADIDKDGEMEIIAGGGAYLLVYSYATGNEEWRSVSMRGPVGALEVADINRDGTLEMIGMVKSGDIYIYDGPSKTLQALLTGPFTTMGLQKVGGTYSIMAGNSNGELMTYGYSSGSYTQTYKQKLVTTSVDGFTLDAQNKVWIGSTALQYDSPGILTKVSPTGAVVAKYAGYGSELGLRTAFPASPLLFFTTGSYAILAFPNCTASLSSASQSVVAAGGSGKVDVQITDSCSWQAASNVDWITMTSSSGTGDGTLNYAVAANITTSFPRIGVLTIAGEVFTVSQEGASCTYTITPTSQNVGPKQSTGSISVTAPIGCAWTARSNSGWISITSGISGNGNGTVNYLADANSSPNPRNGTLTIAGQIFTVTQGALSQIDLVIPAGGVKVFSMRGSASAVQTGYAIGIPNPSKSIEGGTRASPISELYGTAVFSLTQNGIVVTEAGVPSSSLVAHARIFVDYRTNITAKSNPRSTDSISVNTGLAVVNRGGGAANIALALRDSSGRTLSTGTGSLPTNAHRAMFIHELQQLAPDFILPANFPSDIRFGSLEVSSDQPLSIVALRLTNNQRGETLLTTTPVADLAKVPDEVPLFFPQLADGGGFTTALFLLNTSKVVETGTLRMFGNSGAPLAIRRPGDLQDPASVFTYSIPPGGVYALQTDGSSSEVRAGSVQVTPDAGSFVPAGGGIFGYSAGGTLVAETGIPSATPTAHARIYIDRSSGHNTGLAIAAPTIFPLHVTLKAFQVDGTSSAGSGSLDLLGNGHEAKFTNELIPSLPNNFTGVLDISSTSPFVALTLRSLSNSRGDFLMTTFPVADFGQQATTPMVFPQIANGGGYETQFILMSTTSGGSTTLSFYDDNGQPVALGKTGKRDRNILQ
ncbi:MAG: FG-GAP-like repeat-containing protein [Acidobacteriia bacterium]|nr:FG-GAP-like repeat-containing protein [Terriglobia bacterium]